MRTTGVDVDGAARAAGLLLAYRHGNQHAFDTGLAALDCDDAARDLVAALCWVASEAVDETVDGADADGRRSGLRGAGRGGQPGPRPGEERGGGRAGEGGDGLLRRLAAEAPYGERWVATDEEAAPRVAELIEAVQRNDTTAVRELVTATADTTYVLGRLVQAVALLLPAVPRPYLRRVLAALREPGYAWSSAPDGIG
ncbi:hypothetical protein WDH52_19120 [Streptomyces sp. TRM70308]|uniref:hypothetical protein n=1 Tax=Streptomyces sp. TRM70308 TaxID=3131932 RepID=UPI003D05893E